MIEKKETKNNRLLSIFEQLSRGEQPSKQELAEKYGVSERAIQRDISQLKDYFKYCTLEGSKAKLKNDPKTNRYYLKRDENIFLNQKEIFALSKILLESRAFNKKELEQLLDKLLKLTIAEKPIRRSIENERHHYVEPQHGAYLLDSIWQLFEYIKEQRLIEMDYKRQDGSLNRRKVKPVAIMFSEYYFYLVCYMAEMTLDSPTIFRIDRMSNIKPLEERFRVNYAERFQEGEFRKRVQFMYGGELKKVKFRYKGPSAEAVLDRLPTAVSKKESEGVWLFEAEAYGEGINMWLKSQGDRVELLNVAKY